MEYMFTDFVLVVQVVFFVYTDTRRKTHKLHRRNRKRYPGHGAIEHRTGRSSKRTAKCEGEDCGGGLVVGTAADCGGEMFWREMSRECM